MTSVTLTFKAQNLRFSAVSMLLTALCLLPLISQAQVYRIVGSDGRVTFSDKPPLVESQVKSVVGATAAGRAPGNATGLPYELQQVASKYPVTFYVSNDCSPCASARVMLVSRGVPFTEKTVSSNEDVQALQRISGETSLPFLTIGSQQLKGFSDAEWTQYLNAAGYPLTSKLPTGYRAPAPAPLVMARVMTPASTTSTAKLPIVPTTPVQPNANPSGIQF